jgi:hypothetical protein
MVSAASARHSTVDNPTRVRCARAVGTARSVLVME